MRRTIGVGERVSSGERGCIPVDVGERGDGVEGLANGERLGVGRLIPFVAADAAVENARGGAEGGFAVTKRIQGKADTRRDVVPAKVDDATRYALVSGVEKAQRRTGNHRGLNAGNKGGGEVRRLDRRNVNIPAQAEVRGKPGRDPVIVLHEQCGMPVAQ